MQPSRLLFVTAALILVMNYVLLTRIGDLNNQIESLSHNYNNLQASLNSISGNVNNTLERFTREQSWITPVQINNEKTKVENEQGLAVLNWQIKDFPKDAEVAFYYRRSESGEFIAIPAENKGAGFFEVNLPVEVKAEPYWEIVVSKTSRAGSRKTAEQAVRAIPVYESGDTAIGYYVSMKTQDSTRNSEIAYFNLDYLARAKYEPIQGHVNIRDNKYNISLSEHYPVSNNFESVEVKFYDGNSMVTEKAVEAVAGENFQNGSKNYSLAYDAGSQNITHLVIQVQYTNGSIFEKEVTVP